MDGDFNQEDILFITRKFAEIGFKCSHTSYNKIDVDTNYKDYYLTVHRAGNEFYYFVYRPAIGMFVNSLVCQKYLKLNGHKTIDELIESVKNIRNIIICNSVSVRDILYDIERITKEIYCRAQSTTTESYLNELRSVMLSLSKINNAMATDTVI